MPKYKVTLCEERWYYADIEVEAESSAEAMEKAEELANDDEGDTLNWEWTDGRGIDATWVEEVK